MSRPTREVTVRELRSGLADAINEVIARDTVVFVTSRGRRVVALVPVSSGEAVANEKEPK